MPKRRDRHARGLRGPIATRNSLTGAVAPVRRRESGGHFFLGCVEESVDRIKAACPAALDGIAVGVEEVPILHRGWDDAHVPLAAAIEKTPERPGQVVVYRRPLEHRAASRKGLAILVYRTIVEQLAALTGLTVETIDPSGYAEGDEDS